MENRFSVVFQLESISFVASKSSTVVFATTAHRFCQDIFKKISDDLVRSINGSRYEWQLDQTTVCLRRPKWSRSETDTVFALTWFCKGAAENDKSVTESWSFMVLRQMFSGKELLISKWADFLLVFGLSLAFTWLQKTQKSGVFPLSVLLFFLYLLESHPPQRKRLCLFSGVGSTWLSTAGMVVGKTKSKTNCQHFSFLFIYRIFLCKNINFSFNSMYFFMWTLVQADLL